MSVPVLARSEEWGRGYVHPATGEMVPSVTTVIGVISKPLLVPWAARMAAQYAVKNWDELADLPPEDRIDPIRDAAKRYADQTSEFGTLVHDICDAWMQGRPFPEMTARADKSATQFIGFLNAVRPQFAETEVTVWSHRYQYAGTADGIARVNGVTVLLDYKTGSRVYPETGLQLSALANADVILRPDGTEEEMPEITDLAVVHLRPRSWKFIPVYEAGESFRAFRAAREIFRWQRETAESVLGRPWQQMS